MIERITLKSLKVNKTLSEETLCYSATVCLDGVPLMDASNRGQGAADDLWPKQGVPAEKIGELRQLAKELFLADPGPFAPEDIQVKGGEIDLSYIDPLEIIIGRIIEQVEVEKQYKRWCKNKIVFQVEGDPVDQWRTIKRVYRREDRDLVRTTLAQRYPGKTITVLNERYV